MTDGPSEPQPSGPIDQSGPGTSGPPRTSASDSSVPGQFGQPSEPSLPSQPNGPSGGSEVASALPHSDPEDVPPNTEPSPEQVPQTSPEASPARPPEPDTYRVGNVVGWAVLAFLLLWPLMLWAQFIAVVGGPVTSVVAGIVVGVLPVVWAVVKFRRAANKSAASLWLGILIGSALFLVIFSGSCVTLLLTVPL